MQNQLYCKIISPIETIFSENVEMVTIPGKDGEFGVLAGHINFVALTKAGIVNIYNNDVIIKQIYVSKGFAEIKNDNCTILIDEAISLENMIKQDIENKISAINEMLDENLDEDSEDLQNQLDILKNISKNI